jgi:NAD(P)-dependent dehydrogenase (short-subunit alcohol dehydrogenase family)
MRKIVITGHTSGIGKAIYDYFSKDPNNAVFGFSKSTGHNIKDPAKRQEIIEFSRDADIFVNNAFSYTNPDDSQLILLRNMFNTWAGKHKIIINISSIAPASEIQTMYSVLKNALDDFCFSKTLQLPHILNLKPNYVMVETLRKEIGNKPHMTTDQLIEVLDFCINGPVKVKTITFEYK